MNALLDRLAWFGTPIAFTVVLHALVLALLVVRFTPAATIEARVAKPVAIQAKLVSAESLQPKPKPKPKTPAPKKPEPKVEPKKEAPPEKKPDPKPEPDPPKEEEKAETPEPIESEPAKATEEELAAQNLAEIEAALASETTAQEGAIGSASDTVAAIIQQAVVGRWTRPPSARNGMVAVLEIALVPTGDVVGVSVLESSGDVAFDRSAMNAIEKVGRFPEVQQLERALFERDFRRFQLIFRPEDLRY